MAASWHHLFIPLQQTPFLTYLRVVLAYTFSQTYFDSLSVNASKFCSSGNHSRPMSTFLISPYQDYSPFWQIITASMKIFVLQRMKDFYCCIGWFFFLTTILFVKCYNLFQFDFLDENMIWFCWTFSQTNKNLVRFVIGVNIWIWNVNEVNSHGK